jgi:hypothetical protein
LALRGYPGIHAGMPTAQDLRSASVVLRGAKIKIKIKIKSRSLSPSMWLRHCYREQAGSHGWSS